MFSRHKNGIGCKALKLISFQKRKPIIIPMGINKFTKHCQQNENRNGMDWCWKWRWKGIKKKEKHDTRSRNEQQQKNTECLKKVGVRVIMEIRFQLNQGEREKNNNI